MIEYTLEIGDRLLLSGGLVIEILPKNHPKAVNAQMVRIGIDAPSHVTIDRGEMVEKRNGRNHRLQET